MRNELPGFALLAICVGAGLVHSQYGAPGIETITTQLSAVCALLTLILVEVSNE